MPTKPAATLEANGAATKTAAPAVADSYTPQGVSAKIAYIQGLIGSVEKTGHNKHQDFKYFEEHKILELLRPFQRELRLMVVVDFYDCTHEGSLTSMVARVKVTDTEQPLDSTDRTEVAHYPIQASDNHGWGAGKAQTYGKKYALHKFFSIPFAGILDGDSGPAVEQNAPGASQPKRATKKDIDSLRTALGAIADTKDDAAKLTFGNRVGAELQTSHGVQTIDELSAQSIVAFREWVQTEAGKA